MQTCYIHCFECSWVQLVVFGLESCKFCLFSRKTLIVIAGHVEEKHTQQLLWVTDEGNVCLWYVLVWSHTKIFKLYLRSFWTGSMHSSEWSLNGEHWWKTIFQALLPKYCTNSCTCVHRVVLTDLYRHAVSKKKIN